MTPHWMPTVFVSLSSCSLFSSSRHNPAFFPEPSYFFTFFLRKHPSLLYAGDCQELHTLPVSEGLVLLLLKATLPQRGAEKPETHVVHLAGKTKVPEAAWPPKEHKDNAKPIFTFSKISTKESNDRVNSKQLVLLLFDSLSQPPPKLFRLLLSKF